MSGGSVDSAPVWWSSTLRRSQGPMRSGRLAHRLRLAGPTSWDESVHRAALASRRPTLTRFARVATRFAGGASPYPLLAGVVALTAPPGRRRQAVMWSLRRLGAGLGVRFALAQSLRRARPGHHTWLASSTGYSWPSGHTTAVTLVAGLAVEAAHEAGTPLLPAVAVAAPVPLVIGWSRVYLGVHWPTDVLAGWALGLLLLPISRWLPEHDPVVAAWRAARRRQSRSRSSSHSS